VVLNARVMEEIVSAASVGGRAQRREPHPWEPRHEVVEHARRETIGEVGGRRNVALGGDLWRAPVPSVGSTRPRVREGD